MKTVPALLVAAATALLAFGGTDKAQSQGSCCSGRQRSMATAVTEPGSRTSAPDKFGDADQWEPQVASETAAKSPHQAEGTSEAQVLRLEVTGSYSPTELTVKNNVPVVLKVHRKDANNCGGELLIPEFGIRAQLPAGQTTEVKFTPTSAGTFPFTCGMQMMKGQLVVYGDAGQ